MTDLEHKTNLSLIWALEWPSHRVRVVNGHIQVRFGNPTVWTNFDYRDAHTIWPIAKHFQVFPHPYSDNDDNLLGWEVIWPLPNEVRKKGVKKGVWMPKVKWEHLISATAELAVAQAVIQGAKPRLTK